MGTIVTIAMTSGRVDWISAVLAIAVATLSARGFVRLRGTTLAAPALWTVAAALMLAAADGVLTWRPNLAETFGASLARYATAAGTFCPLIAVLGAKRPQDRGWQWVVLTLWIVLLAPAGQAWAGRSGRFEAIGPAWQMMLYALMGLGLLNYLPTRHALAALLVAAGQQGLLFEFLFSREAHSHSLHRIVGLGLCLLAAILVRPARAEELPTAASRIAPFNRRWMAFRDNWGAFWALRVMGRVNESAELSGWPVRLGWRGFTSADGTAPPDVDDRVAAQIEQAMDSLLRRFERIETAPQTAPPREK